LEFNSKVFGGSNSKVLEFFLKKTHGDLEFFLQGFGVFSPRSWSFVSKVVEFVFQGLGVLSPRSWSFISKVLELYLQGLGEKSPSHREFYIKISKVLEFYLQGLGVLSPSLWSYNSKTLEFYLQDLGVTTPHPFSPLAAPPGAPRARGEGRAHQSTSNWSTVIRPAILEGGVGAQGMCVGVFGGSVWRKKSVWGRREGQLWACAQD